MEKIRTAVIGIGNMGKHHVRNYFEITNSNLVAIADLNEELGKETANKYGCKYYKDYIEMIEAEKPIAVTIAVPSKFHHKVALDVISRGINVLLEKPIAMTEKEADEIIAAANKHNSKLMIGHIERFNPGVIRLKKLMDSGDLGKITSIIARRVGIFPPQIKDANVLVDLGVHDIDIINYLLERLPNKISSNGGKALLDSREDYAEVFMNYGDISGYVQVNWITPVKIRNLAVTGEKGYAELNYITQKLTVYKSIVTKEDDGFGDFVIKFGEPEAIDLEVDTKEPLKAEIESFLAATSGKNSIVTTGEDGREALKIALEAQRQLKEGDTR